MMAAHKENAMKYNFRPLRELADAVAAKSAGNYQYRSPESWRELALLARQLADECDKAAAFDGSQDA